MLMGPEGGEQDQFTAPRRDADVLVEKPGLAAGPRNLIEVPDRNQLPLAEFMAAPIDVPMVKLAGSVTLHLVADVLERPLEIGVGPAKLPHGRGQGAEEHPVHILPVLLVAHHQIRGRFHPAVLDPGLADAAWVLLLGVGLEALDYLVTERGRQGQWSLEDEAAGLDLPDTHKGFDPGFDRRAHGLVHGLDVLCRFRVTLFGAPCIVRITHRAREWF